MTDSSRVVVTAIVGGQESLTEQAVAADSQMSFVCLTDDPQLSSQTWQIRQLDPILPGDPARSAAEAKLRVHRHLPEAVEVLWIDPSLLLTAVPDELVEHWLAQADVTMPCGRGSLAEEFAAVATLGLDDLPRIYEQYSHYRAAHPEILEEPTPCTAVLARRMTAPGVRELGERWMDEVLRYSRRDQLSARAALHRSSVPFAMVDQEGLIVSDPSRTGASRCEARGGARHPVLDFVPESLAAARQEAAGASARGEIAERDARLAEMAEERADLVAEISALTAELSTQGGALAVARGQLDSVLASRSFRLTSGPRRAAASARSALGRPPR